MHGISTIGNVVYIVAKLTKNYKLGIDKFWIELASIIDLISLFQILKNIIMF